MHDPIDQRWAAGEDGAKGGNGADLSEKAEPAEDEETDEEATSEAEAPPDPLEQALAERDRYREQMLRAAADLDNFRKRARREIEDARNRGRDDMLRTLLPVMDNFERALEHSSSGGDAEAVLEGLRMVQKLLADTLTRSGVEAITETGVPFDPAVHDALQKQATAEQPPGTILAVVQKGYRVGERLVRPATVVVAVAPDPPDEKSADEVAPGDHPAEKGEDAEEPPNEDG